MKKPIISTIFFILCGATLPAEETIKDADAWQINLTRPISSIDVADGIDVFEANYLAQWYFLQFGGSCGFADPVTKNGSWWEASTAIGPTGVEGGIIKIHAEKGIITWRSGKWMTPPWKELEEFIIPFQNRTSPKISEL